MGSPKALLDFQGETFLDRLIGILGRHCSSMTVVLGHEPETILAGIRRSDEARFEVNPDWENGQLSSLKCGLRAIGNADAVLFTPVDYPAIQASTVAALAAALASDRGDHLVFVPTFDGKHGHPICFRSDLLPQFLTLPADATARDVIHSLRGRTLYVEVCDPGILMDIDSPEAYQALRAEGRT
jgi:molybdenum cofactor cytidylyltransferase